MKRKFTYLLLLFVILIWGVVFNRLFFSKDEPKTISVKTAQTIPQKIAAPTYELIADYQDPFFERKSIKKAPVPVVSQVMETYVEPEEQITIPPLKYIGLIQNPTTKKQIILINFEGKDLMLAQGETKNGIILLETTDEYIKVQYSGIIKFIYK